MIDHVKSGSCSLTAFVTWLKRLNACPFCVLTLTVKDDALLEGCCTYITCGCKSWFSPVHMSWLQLSFYQGNKAESRRNLLWIWRVIKLQTGKHNNYHNTVSWMFVKLSQKVLKSFMSMATRHNLENYMFLLAQAFVPAAQSHGSMWNSREASNSNTRLSPARPCFCVVFTWLGNKKTMVLG